MDVELDLRTAAAVARGGLEFDVEDSAGTGNDTRPKAGMDPRARGTVFGEGFDLEVRGAVGIQVKQGVCKSLRNRGGVSQWY